MARVFVTSPLPGFEGLAERLEGHELVVWEGAGPCPRATILEEARRSQALITLLSDPIDAEVVTAGPQVVANYAVGFDNIDLEAARGAGVVVTNTPDVLTDATADLAFSLLLAAARRLPESERFLREGRFEGWGPSLYLGKPVWGRRLAVVGAGRIGQAMLARGRGFGMELAYVGRRPLDPAREAALGARKMPLDEALAWADFVSLHTPLTPETRHLIDRRRLELMGPGAVLVNTARGPVIDEAALAAALSAEQLFGAGLDVFEAEPAVHPGLLESPRAVLTPHTGSATDVARAQMAEICGESVRAVLAGETPRHVVVDGR